MDPNPGYRFCGYNLLRHERSEDTYITMNVICYLHIHVMHSITAVYKFLPACGQVHQLVNIGTDQSLPGRLVDRLEECPAPQFTSVSKAGVIKGVVLALKDLS